MVALLPEYPTGFDNNWWQSKKGKIAKIATAGDGTGIGKQLDALKIAFNKVNWDLFRTAEVLKGVSKADLSVAHVTQFVEGCKGQIPKTAEARKLASNLEDAANRLADEWAKSKLIPKSSTAAARDVADKANKLCYAMTPATLGEYMKQEVEAIETEIKKQRANYDMAVGKVTPRLKAILSGAPKLKKPEEWSSFWSEEVRALGTTIPYVAANNAKLKPHATAFKKIISNQEAPKTKEELDERVSEIVKIAKIVQVCLT